MSRKKKVPKNSERNFVRGLAILALTLEYAEAHPEMDAADCLDVIRASHPELLVPEEEMMVGE